ncbi:MFS transporter [Microbacterium marinilacus]|uniref:MFS transporter n=1 Tax=Microbacterium marinilacus TaxID=415209 RepID=A0ABP7B8T0_9MICO
MLQAISGLMAAMFVVLVSSTVVATPMPRIMSDLNGTNTEYTWVLVAAFLSMTVSTPIWGKLADIFNRKLLLQLALAIFTVATVAAGFAGQIGGATHEGGASWLIGWRFVQALGTGGLMALGQVVIADIISPRERGKYMGIMGAVMAVGQIGGPLLGGVIADSWGWEWCFFVCAPIAVVAFVMIQATLHVSDIRRKVKIDYLGAGLIVSGISILLIWISLGGKTEDTGGFPWDSTNSIVLVSIGAVLTIAAIVTEFLVEEPIIPVRLFAQRTFALASVASVAVGVTMFGTSVFLSQYLQFARGLTPTDSGLATIPMVIGSMAGAVGVGQAISRTGRWKPFVIGGSVALLAGLALMSRIHYDTDIWSVWLNMFLLGLGSGVLMQNLVLVTQNSLPATQLGAGSGAVTFFRSLGGTVGVSVLGSVLGAQVGDRIKDGLSALLEKIDPTLQVPSLLVDNPDCADSVDALGTGAVPAVGQLCEPVRTVVESSYGDSIAFLFLLVVPLAIVTFLCVCFLPNLPLSRKTAAEQIEEELGAELAALEPAERGGEGFRELVETGQIVLPEQTGTGKRGDRR